MRGKTFTWIMIVLFVQELHWLSFKNFTNLVHSKCQSEMFTTNFTTTNTSKWIANTAYMYIKWYILHVCVERILKNKKDHPYLWILMRGRRLF